MIVTGSLTYVITADWLLYYCHITAIRLLRFSSIRDMKNSYHFWINFDYVNFSHMIDDVYFYFKFQ